MNDRAFEEALYQSVTSAGCTRCKHPLWWHDRLAGCQKRLKRGQRIGTRCRCSAFTKGTGP